jgi:hypothetical protein
MGPITLFDKSFIQSLSLDEAVWFDKFFMPVVCPIFFVETLADLGKEESKRGSAESATMYHHPNCTQSRPKLRRLVFGCCRARLFRLYQPSPHVFDGSHPQPRATKPSWIGRAGHFDLPQVKRVQ